MEFTKLDIQGHRGARGLYPENTITAFIEAVKIGVDTIEMDVVMSKDMQVVVSHEAWMNPLFCNKPDGNSISELNYQNTYNLFKMDYVDIKKYNCGLIKHPEFKEQQSVSSHKPLLSEVIQIVDSYTSTYNVPKVKYNIEIKTEPDHGTRFNPEPHAFAKAVYTIVKQLNCLNRTIIQSFDVDVLKAIKAIDAHQTLSFLVENTDSFQTNLNRLGFIPNIYGPEYILITDELINTLKGLNIKLIPWTVNEISDMKILIDKGVHGIITDYPDRLIKLLKSL